MLQTYKFVARLFLHYFSSGTGTLAIASILVHDEK